MNKQLSPMRPVPGMEGLYSMTEDKRIYDHRTNILQANPTHMYKFIDSNGSVYSRVVGKVYNYTYTDKLLETLNGKQHPSYPDYIACPTGQVYSMQLSKFLEQSIQMREGNQGKYNLRVDVKDTDGNKKTYLTHRFIAETFIPNPELKPEVNHIDGNPANNNVDNLEWATRAENLQHIYDNGLNDGCKIPCIQSELSAEEVLVGTYASAKEVSEALNINKLVSSISRGALLNEGVEAGSLEAATIDGYVMRYESSYVSEPKVAEIVEPVEREEKDINKVEYKLIERAPRYAITIDGRVYDLAKNKWISITKAYDKKNDTHRATASLHVEGRQYLTINVANQVLQAFTVDKPANAKIAYRNGNVLDCALDNVYYKRSNRSEKPISVYKQIWKEKQVAAYDSIMQAAGTIGVWFQTLAEVINKNDYVGVGEKPYTCQGYVFRKA